LKSIDHSKLLKGVYEAERLPRDFSPERTVPDFAFNILNPLGKLYHPVVDEQRIRTGRAKAVWPKRKPFAVCLTHDVDAVVIDSLRHCARKFIERIRDGGSEARKAHEFIAIGMDAARVIKHAKWTDPLCCYERWLDVEKNVGARSTFFFWPGWKAVAKHHPSDCNYELTDRILFDGQKCTVEEMIQEMDRRGWEIGLHPSWYSFDNIDEMKRQKEALETSLGHDVVSVRQHYLHYDIRVTPSIQAQAGFKYDSTLGFNDNVGFRFGTCYPWKLYDISAEEKLPITEIPLLIQDGALLNPGKGMRLDEDTAYQYVLQITEAVESVGGVLTLLWHPNQIHKSEWWNLYCRTLEMLAAKNAWFSTIEQAGKWFQSSAEGKV
jgi:peptidoglycan/xylan/chitin deacetylase (PgdA/CDA1 family)